MATVVDSLVVTLGLDPTQFNKAQKEAASAWLKTREEAQKSGKAIEEQSDKTAAALKRIAVEALGMFAVFTGSIGLRNFIDDLIRANVALGNIATNFGETPALVSAWGAAAERVGGSANATIGTITKIKEALLDLNINGKNLPEAYYRLMADSKVTIDRNHGAVRFLEDTAKAVQALAATGEEGKQRAAFYARGMGIDEGTITLMLKGGDALKTMLDNARSLAPTPEQVRASQDLTAAYVTLSQTMASLGQSVLPALDKVLTPVLNGFAKWISDNKSLIDSGVAKVFDTIANAFNDIAAAFPQMNAGMSNFSVVANDVATSISTIASAIVSLEHAASTVGGVLGAAQNFARGVGGLDDAGSETYNKGGSFETTVGKGSIAAKIMSFFGAGPDVAGHRATGGATGPGRSYIVGERGPELFTPSDGGTISPNGAGGDLQVDGRPVTKSNPMPIELSNQGGGENWAQTIAGWFGGGSGGGGGGGLLSGIGNGIKHILGGGSSGGDSGGGPYNPATGAPGTYRPVYKLGPRDLSDSVVNTINGEATRTQQSTDAVINNMFNRLGTHTYGPSGDLQAVARAPGQYAASPNTKTSAARAAEIRARIRAIASGEVEDITHGSNEYRAGWYHGPWGQKHASSPVIGGNRFAYNSKGGRGPFSPYEHPNAGGAAFAAAYHNTSTSSSQSNTTNVNGPITVHTAATDGQGVAAALKASLQRTAAVNPANTGLR